MAFIPMVVEAVGGSWGPQAHKFWASLANSLAQASGERKEDMAEQIFQNLGLIFHRENARAIIRRASGLAAASEPHILGALASLAPHGADQEAF